MATFMQKIPPQPPPPSSDAFSSPLNPAATSVSSMVNVHVDPRDNKNNTNANDNTDNDNYLYKSYYCYDDHDNDYYDDRDNNVDDDPCIRPL